MEIKDVEKLAELVKIELSEEEKKTILKDMDGILAYVKAIEEVDVGNVTTQYGLHNIWREDETGSREFKKELVTSQFPDAQEGFLKVKKIL